MQKKQFVYLFNFYLTQLPPLVMKKWDKQWRTVMKETRRLLTYSIRRSCFWNMKEISKSPRLTTCVITSGSQNSKHSLMKYSSETFDNFYIEDFKQTEVDMRNIIHENLQHLELYKILTRKNQWSDLHARWSIHDCPLSGHLWDRFIIKSLPEGWKNCKIDCFLREWQPGTGPSLQLRPNRDGQVCKTKVTFPQPFPWYARWELWWFLLIQFWSLRRNRQS